LQVTVPALEDGDRDGLPITAAPADALRATGAPEKPYDRGPMARSQRVLGAVVAGVGVVGIGVGTVFAFDAKSTYDASNRGGHCLPDDECDGEGRQDRDHAKQKALVATISMAVGAAAVAGGAVLYFLAPKGNTDVGVVSLTADPRSASLRVRLAW
jgi:serine/threonine-protein kinase